MRHCDGPWERARLTEVKSGSDAQGVVVGGIVTNEPKIVDRLIQRFP